MRLLTSFLLLFVFTSCEEKELLRARAKDNFFVRNAGADIPVIVEGNTASKIFILYVHGGPSTGGIGENYNTRFTGPLEEKYAMVYYDQRGMGVSGGNYDEKKLTLEQSVEDLEKIIIAVKRRYGKDIKIFLFGGSWGGLLGSAFLIKGDNQSAVSGWIEVGGGHNIPLVKTASKSLLIEVGGQQIAKGNSTKEWQSLIKFANGYDPCIDGLENWLEMNKKGQEATQLLVNDGEVKSSSLSGRDMMNYVFFSPSNILTIATNDNINQSGMVMLKNSNIGSYSCSHLLNKVKIPSLFLWGEYDFAVPPEVGEDGFKQIGTPVENKKLVIFKNGEHNILNSNTNQVQDEFFAFVERFK